MTHVISLSKDQIVSGETALIAAPRNGGAGLRPIVAIHGAGAVPAQYRDFTGAPGSAGLFDAAADLGMLLVCTEMGGTQTWGVDGVLTEFDAILTYISSHYPGVLLDQVVLWGASMGNQNALRIAADRRSRVAAVVSNIPLCDIQNARSTNALGIRGLSDAAWGITYPTPVPYRGDVLARAQAGEYAGLPWLGWNSSGDTACPPSTVAALVSAIGPTASNVVTSAADHSDAPIAATLNTPAFLARFLNFITAYSR